MPVPYDIGGTKPVREFSLNYKHVFSMEYLYKGIHNWLVEEGYDGVTEYGKKGDNWRERLYLERGLAPGVKQVWIWWRNTKDHSNLVTFNLNVDFHALGLTNHDVVVDGVKTKTNKGEVEIFIKATMVVDPKKTWNNSFFLKNKYIQNFFLNRIYKKNIEGAEKKLIRDSARLLGMIKQYMQLENWLPEYKAKSFHPEKGIEGA